MTDMQRRILAVMEEGKAYNSRHILEGLAEGPYAEAPDSCIASSMGWLTRKGTVTYDKKRQEWTRAEQFNLFDELKKGMEEAIEIARGGELSNSGLHGSGFTRVQVAEKPWKEPLPEDPGALRRVAERLQQTIQVYDAVINLELDAEARVKFSHDAVKWHRKLFGETR